MPLSAGFEVDMDWFLIISLWILSLFGAVFFGHETARIVHKMDKEYIELSDNEKLHACHDVIAGFQQ